MAIDTNLVEEEARFLMGGLDTSTFSSTLMQKIIAKGIAAYEDDEEYYCQVLYYTILETLRYLSRQNQLILANAGATGAVSKHSEKEGDVTITTEYDTEADDVSYDSMLDDFLAHPEYVCDELVGDSDGLVIVGGVSISESNRVNQNSDGRNGLTSGVSNYDKIFNSPYSNHLGRNRRDGKWFNS